jgi:hypothetical protein
MGCALSLLIIAGGVLFVLSVIRWYEQATDAVDRGNWGTVSLLLIVPPAVWLFPSRVVAGRPTAVPHHEPVRGFGAIPKAKPAPFATEGPPPGTPKEFLTKPSVPPLVTKRAKSAIDLEKIEKLRRKMREQGMLPPEDGNAG